jgi:hypothetical protein
MMCSEKSFLSSVSGWLATLGLFLMLPGLLLVAWVRHVTHLPIPAWSMWLLALFSNYCLFRYLARANGGSRLQGFIWHWTLGTVTFFALLLVSALAPDSVNRRIGTLIAAAIGYYLPS